MLRRFVLMPVILLLAFMLSSCHYVKGDFTINEEGLVSGTVVIAVPKKTDPKIRQNIFKKTVNPAAKEYVKTEDWSNKNLIGRKYTYSNAPFATIFPEGSDITFTKVGEAYVLESTAGLNQKDLPQLKTAKDGKKKPKPINYKPNWSLTITMPLPVESATEGIVIDETDPAKIIVPNEFFSEKKPFKVVAGTMEQYNPEDYTPREVVTAQPPPMPQQPSNIPVIISWFLILGGLALAIFARKIDFVSIQQSRVKKSSTKKNKVKKK